MASLQILSVLLGFASYCTFTVTNQAQIQDFNFGGVNRGPKGQEWGQGSWGGGRWGPGLSPSRQMVLPYFKHSGCPLLALQWCFVIEDRKSQASCDCYLGPVPLSHSVEHGACQKLIPDLKHCNRQHKLR